MTTPDYLVIGTITKDLIPEGFTVGGTVTYGAVTAQRLGKQAAVVTSAEPDLPLPPTYDNILYECVPAQDTTTFRNVYSYGTRMQYLHERGGDIRAEHIPTDWLQTSMVHLGPLAQEVDESLVHLFPNSRVVATPQGWFRSWDESGLVSLGEWAGAGRLLPHLTALILSDQDVCDSPECIQQFADMTRTLVVTNGAQGATVYHHGQVRQIPTRAAREVDPTGAGDVFAAAFVIKLHESAIESGTENPWEAAHFANIVASFSVEGSGPRSVPDRQQVEAYLRTAGSIPGNS